MSEGLQPVVELAPGTRAQGRTFPAAKGVDGSVYAFLGLPYAQPPVGPLRFQPPQPIPLWSGDRDATKYGAICPQNTAALATFPGVKINVPAKMSEDCLFLNVWTQSLDSNANKPVMFFIHGGGLSGGHSDTYQGNGLASLGDVVVVTINYRLNIFGFMTTGDGVITGNYGILDQIEALRWVQRNIRAFGGDPDNVTIFGESAGSMSVSCLLLSPLAKGLFRRGICESGTITCPGFSATPKAAAEEFKPFLDKIGCQSENSQEILAFLRNQPADTLFSNTDLTTTFSILIDGSVLRQEDVERGLNPDNGALDLMIGLNSHEGGMMAYLFSGMNCTDLDAATKAISGYIATFAGPEHLGIVDAVMKEYFNDTSSEDAIFRSVVTCMGDFMFLPSTIAAAQGHSKGAGRTYLYNYWYRYSGSPHPAWLSADHGEEVVMVLGYPFIDFSEQMSVGLTSADEEMSRTIIKYWTNFAKTGDPNGEGMVEWPEYNREEQRHLVIDRPCSTDSRLHAGRVQFWNDLLNKNSQA